MVMNPASIAAGVAVGVAAEQANKFVEHVAKEQEIDHPSEWQLLEQIRDFTKLTAEALNTTLTHNLDIPIALQAYPKSWTLPEHDRKHVCMFIGSGATGTAGNYAPVLTTVKLYFEIPVAGTHIKSMSIGWNQLDLPPGTLIYTADGNTYPVIVSFRDDPIGAAI